MPLAELATLPFLRDLSPDAIAALSEQVVRHEYPLNVRVIHEGDTGRSMFFLAQGSVRVVRGEGEDIVDHIAAPSLFGEMALVASAPRLASVVTDGPCTLFELSRDVVFALAEHYPTIRDTILAFHRRRLMSTILTANSIFGPIPDEKKHKLAESFVSQTVAAGQVLLQEGQPGIGLYVLLRGRCEVVHQRPDGDGEVKITELAEGEIFGEISIVLFDQPCTATVRTLNECVVLLLSRQTFQEAMMSNPAVRDAIIKLALKRRRETEELRGRPSYANLI